MKLGDDAFEALCSTLREEAAEQVERIGASLLEIEQGVEADRLAALLDQSFREAHNLKGAAGSLGFGLASKLAHAVESVLSKLRKADLHACLQEFDSLHQGLSLVDRALAVGPGAETDPAVDRIIAQLEACEVAATPEEPAQPAAVPAVRAETPAGPPRTGAVAVVPAAPARGEESLRVSMRKLNALMAQVGELLAARLRTDQRLA